MTYAILELEQDELAGVEGYWRWKARVVCESDGDLGFAIEDLETTGCLNTSHGRGFIPSPIAAAQFAEQAIDQMPRAIAQALRDYTRKCVDDSQDTLMDEMDDQAREEHDDQLVSEGVNWRGVFRS